MFRWAVIARDHMKIDGLKNSSVCFHVISDDGGPPKHVGSLINGFFLIVCLLVFPIIQGVYK